MSTTLNLGSQIPPVPAIQEQLTGREVTRVLDVERDGTVLVEVALENLQVGSGGATEAKLVGPLMVRVRPDGRVVETQTGSETDVFPFRFPDRLIAAGQSWTQQGLNESPELDVKARINTRFTLSAVEQAGDDRVARIAFRQEGTISHLRVGMLHALTGRDPEKVSGTWRSTGVVRWSLGRGRILGESREVVVNGKFEFSGPAGTLAGVQTTKMTARRDPLPAAGVQTARVAPDRLIAPGKAIGILRLDQSVTELTDRFGQPQRIQGGMGTRVTLLAWSNIGAFIDSADTTKLVGLVVGDPGFRTDKGIGFGSSQGAVLMGYGLRPLKHEIVIADLGGVRMLIYNDLGLAFAITSDATHAGKGPDHAPIGAVDWIVVFPPGEASKLYTLPSR